MCRTQAKETITSFKIVTERMHFPSEEHFKVFFKAAPGTTQFTKESNQAAKMKTVCFSLVELLIKRSQRQTVFAFAFNTDIHPA